MKQNEPTIDPTPVFSRLTSHESKEGYECVIEGVLYAEGHALYRARMKSIAPVLEIYKGVPPPVGEEPDPENLLMWRLMPDGLE